MGNLTLLPMKLAPFEDAVHSDLKSDVDRDKVAVRVQQNLDNKHHRYLVDLEKSAQFEQDAIEALLSIRPEIEKTLSHTSEYSIEIERSETQTADIVEAASIYVDTKTEKKHFARTAATKANTIRADDTQTHTEDFEQVHDIFYGQTNTIKTPGNKYLRHVVSLHADRYYSASHSDRKVITSKVADRIASRGSRFLKKTNADWREMSRYEIIGKICQTFRSMKSYKKKRQGPSFIQEKTDPPQMTYKRLHLAAAEASKEKRYTNMQGTLKILEGKSQGPDQEVDEILKGKNQASSSEEGNVIAKSDAGCNGMPTPEASGNISQQFRSVTHYRKKKQRASFQQETMECPNEKNNASDLEGEIVLCERVKSILPTPKENIEKHGDMLQDSKTTTSGESATMIPLHRDAIDGQGFNDDSLQTTLCRDLDRQLPTATTRNDFRTNRSLLTMETAAALAECARAESILKANQSALYLKMAAEAKAESERAEAILRANELFLFRNTSDANVPGKPQQFLSKKASRDERLPEKTPDVKMAVEAKVESANQSFVCTKIADTNGHQNAQHDQSPAHTSVKAPPLSTPDVLYGQSKFKSSPGNTYLRQLVATSADQYFSAKHKDRQLITSCIAEQIQSHGGRFLKLKKNGTGSAETLKNRGWQELTKKEAITKICQIFRDMKQCKNDRKIARSIKKRNEAERPRSANSRFRKNESDASYVEIKKPSDGEIEGARGWLNMNNMKKRSMPQSAPSEDSLARYWDWEEIEAPMDVYLSHGTSEESDEENEGASDRKIEDTVILKSIKAISSIQQPALKGDNNNSTALPRFSDVITDEGTDITNYMYHPGNIYLRRMVAAVAPQYFLVNHGDRKTITGCLVDQFHSHGGHFLKWGGTGWEKLNRADAIGKIHQSFRNNNPGNKFLHRLVAEFGERFTSADYCNRKLITDSIAEQIYSRGGRFLMITKSGLQTLNTSDATGEICQMIFQRRVIPNNEEAANLVGAVPP